MRFRSTARYAAALAIGALPAPSAAGSDSAALATGNEYLALCTSTAATDRLACIIYTRGLFEGMVKGPQYYAAARGLPDPDPTFCIPEGADVPQIRDITIKYLRENPADRASPPSFLMYLALMKAWPCTK